MLKTKNERVEADSKALSQCGWKPSDTFNRKMEKLETGRNQIERE